MKSPGINVNGCNQSFLTLPYFIYLTRGDIKREKERERRERERERCIPSHKAPRKAQSACRPFEDSNPGHCRPLGRFSCWLESFRRGSHYFSYLEPLNLGFSHQSVCVCVVCVCVVCVCVVCVCVRRVCAIIFQENPLVHCD